MIYWSDKHIANICVSVTIHSRQNKTRATTMWSETRTVWNSLGTSLFLCEHTQYEASLEVRLESGGDDDVFTRRQFEALAHLSQVDEGAAPCNGPLTQQYVRTEMNIVATLEL